MALRSPRSWRFRARGAMAQPHAGKLPGGSAGQSAWKSQGARGLCLQGTRAAVEAPAPERPVSAPPSSLHLGLLRSGHPCPRVLSNMPIISGNTLLNISRSLLILGICQCNHIFYLLFVFGLSKAHFLLNYQCDLFKEIPATGDGILFHHLLTEDLGV